MWLIYNDVLVSGVWQSDSEKYICVCILGLVAQLCLTLCDPMDYIAHQTPLTMEFSRQEYWSGLLYPPPRIFPTQGLNQISCMTGRFFTDWATREAQEYWSGEPIPSSGGLPDPGIELGSPALQVDSLPTELPAKSICIYIYIFFFLFYHR